MLYTIYSNRFATTRGLLWLILGAVCLGLVFGIIALILDQFFWLLVLFPFMFGIVSGAILGKLISIFKVAHQLLAIAVGIGMGMVIAGTMHYGNYELFQSQLRTMIVDETGELDPNIQNAMIDTVLKEATGTTGFFGYMKLMAEEGFSIGRGDRPTDTSVPVTGIFVWVHWLLEVGFISGTAAVLAHRAAGKPFCEKCQDWYQSGAHLGSITKGAEQRFIEAVQTGDVRLGGQLLVNHAEAMPRMEVYLQRCAQPQIHDAFLSIEHRWINKKKQIESKVALGGLLSVQRVEELLRGRTEPARM